MQRLSFILALSTGLLLAGCSYNEKNMGDARITVPILADQNWKMTQESTLNGGDKVCTISAGDLDVTRRSFSGKMVEQVAISYKPEPGQRFKILVGNNQYEIPNQEWFSESDSHTIIQQFKEQTIAYTEKLALVTNRHDGVLHRYDNTIDLRGFATQYQACERYIP